MGLRCCLCTNCGGDCLQCLCEIGNEVLRLLEPDAEANEAICDTCLSAPVCRDTFVGHGGRVTDEAFDTTETLCQLEVLCSGDEGGGSGLGIGQ